MNRMWRKKQLEGLLWNFAGVGLKFKKKRGVKKKTQLDTKFKWDDHIFGSNPCYWIIEGRYFLAILQQENSILLSLYTRKKPNSCTPSLAVKDAIGKIDFFFFLAKKKRGMDDSKRVEVEVKELSWRWDIFVMLFSAGGGVGLLNWILYYTIMYNYSPFLL